MCSTQIDRPNSLDFTEIFVRLKRTSLLRQKNCKKDFKDSESFYGPLWAQRCKNFTAVIPKCSYKARVFVTGNNLQPSLMFLRNAGAYHSEAPLALGWAPGLTPQ
jgi:hypothetical protein